jgi:hypothetical protein
MMGYAHVMGPDRSTTALIVAAEQRLPADSCTMGLQRAEPNGPFLVLVAALLSVQARDNVAMAAMRRLRADFAAAAAAADAPPGEPRRAEGANPLQPSGTLTVESVCEWEVRCSPMLTQLPPRAHYCSRRSRGVVTHGAVVSLALLLTACLGPGLCHNMVLVTTWSSLHRRYIVSLALLLTACLGPGLCLRACAAARSGGRSGEKLVHAQLLPLQSLVSASPELLLIGRLG